MGLFDVVWIPCPNCKKKFDWQTKIGECFLHDYELEEAPPLLQAAASQEIFTCTCGTRFRVLIQTMVRVEGEGEDKWEDEGGKLFDIYDD